MITASSTFEIVSRTPADSPLAEDGAVSYGRMVLAKSFHGDIEARSTVDMLFTRTPDGAGGFAGAGYVALERITGTLHGRTGTFALLHLSTVTANGQTVSSWPISPGSGGGDLEGIRGEGRIDIATDGSHTLTLDYELA